jgi:hypothetical protein
MLSELTGIDSCYLIFSQSRRAFRLDLAGYAARRPAEGEEVV